MLQYPNRHSPLELKQNLEKQNFTVEPSKGTLQDNLEYLIEQSIEQFSTDEETIDNATKQHNVQISIHHGDMDEPIIEHGKGKHDETINLLFNEDDQQYQPIVPNKEKEQSKKPTAPKKRKPFLDTNQHSDLLVHWSIDEDKINFNHSFSQGVLKCDVSWNVVQWEENLDKVKKYITANDFLPSPHSKDPTVKKLASWVSTQKQQYKKQTNIMKDPMIRNQWTQLMNQHPLMFQTNEDSWMETLNELQQYITTNDYLPTNISKDPTVKKLASWVSTQKQQYKKQTYIMKDPMIHNQWTQIIKQHQLMFQTNEDSWMETLKETHSADGLVDSLQKNVARKRAIGTHECATLFGDPANCLHVSIAARWSPNPGQVQCR